MYNEKSLGQLTQEYRFSGQIGAGGMGAIYRAHHQMLNRDVAIKILHQVNELTVQRFQREAQAVFNLHHENIVAVHQFGVTEDGQPYMVMEYIEGKTLSTVLIERGALPVDLCVKIFKQVCSGMSHAHSKGVLHRDLKPSNIMLTEPESWSPLVRIVDFGIAKVLDQEDTLSGKLTRTGDFVGSPMYMSPEQCLGKNIDLRTDIYSIGCIMYEALTGNPPFNGGTSMEIMLKQMNDAAPSLKEGAGGHHFPVWLERFVARCLAKDPDARFQTIEEVRRALDDRIVSEAKIGSARGKGSLNLPLVIGSGVVLLAVAAGGALFYSANQKKQLPTPTPESRMPSEIIKAQVPELYKDSKKKQLSDTDHAAGMAAISHDDILQRLVSDRTRTVITNQGQTVSDDALKGLKDRYDIKELQITDSKISDKALSHAAHLPLTRVDFSDNQGVTGKVLEYIKPDYLEELRLNKTGFTGSALQALTRYKNLRVLTLANDNITDAKISSLAELRNLTILDLSANPIGDGIFSVVSKLNQLRDLNLSRTKVTGASIGYLKSLKNLTTLNLSETNVADSGVSALQSQNLMALELLDTGITGNAINSIVKLKGLRQFGLERVKLSHEDVKKLANMKLNRLILYQCGIDDDDLKILSECSTLRELHLSGNSAITGVGLNSLSKLPLQEIVLVKTSVTDQDLPIFYKWKDLRSIDLDRCNVSNNGVAALKKALGSECSVLPFDTPSIRNINFGSPI